MNEIEMIAAIVFSISILSFIAYAWFSQKLYKFEESLFNAISMIAESSRMGEAPESTIKRISDMKNEACAKAFKNIIRHIENGKTFAEALGDISEKYHSETLVLLARVLIDSQESGTNVYDAMNAYSDKIWKLKQLETYAKKSTSSNLFVLKMMSVVILPAVFYYMPVVLEEVFIPSYSIYYFAVFGAIIGLADALVYNEYVNSLIYVPMLSSLPIVIVWILGNIKIL